MHSRVRIVADSDTLSAHSTPISALEAALGGTGPDATDINPSRRSEP
jgi:hypothetical protein